MDRYSALYVVSDLHIGGEPDRAIFQDADALAAVIRRVARLEEPGAVGFVLGGDVLDLLAEPGAAGFHADNAAARVRAILTRPCFRPVFDALAELVATPQRYLVVVVGNHDVELALPDVHNALRDRLGARTGEASGRVRFATDGTGYTALVGPPGLSKRVLVMHGEVADLQNVIDHGRLVEIIRARKNGTPPPAFPEPIGTHIVLEVINPIKERYPIIDLLKPEFAGAASLASVLVHREPGGKARWASLVKAGVGNWRAYARAVWRRTFGLLDDEGGVAGGHVERRRYDPREAGDRLVEEVLKSGDDDELVDDELLISISDLELILPFRSPDVEDLRKKWLEIAEGERKKGSTSPWCETASEDTVAYVERHTGADVDVVVAGHTHLRRALWGKGAWMGRYFNSGTWIQLMRIPEHLESPEAFRRWVERVAACDTVAALRASADGPPLVFSQRTVVVIEARGDDVMAGLTEVVGAPRNQARALGGDLWLEDVEGTWTPL